MDNTVSQEGFQTVEEYNAVKRPDGNDQLALFQDMAITRSNSIEETQKQLKTAKEMYEDTFNNNPLYREEAEIVKKIQTKLKEVKVQIERDPAVIAQAATIKQLQNEIKEKKSEISDYAMEVFRMTGNNEFTKDGETFEIKAVAKLVKRKQ